MSVRISASVCTAAQNRYLRCEALLEHKDEWLRALKHEVSNNIEIDQWWSVMLGNVLNEIKNYTETEVRQNMKQCIADDIARRAAMQRFVGNWVLRELARHDLRDVTLTTHTIPCTSRGPSPTR